jgi:hypothetical protein
MANKAYVNNQLIDITDEEIAQMSEGFSLSDTLASAARYKRDQLIEATDVWALSDRTMTAEQTAYRQALRDITDQAGFPHNITWPTKPAS